MPLVQDRSLNLLASSPARYHCTTDAPWYNKTYLCWLTITITTIMVYFYMAHIQIGTIHFAIWSIIQVFISHTNTIMWQPFLTKFKVIHRSHSHRKVVKIWNPLNVLGTQNLHHPELCALEHYPTSQPNSSISKWTAIFLLHLAYHYNNSQLYQGHFRVC